MEYLDLYSSAIREFSNIIQDKNEPVMMCMYRGKDYSIVPGEITSFEEKVDMKNISWKVLQETIAKIHSSIPASITTSSEVYRYFQEKINKKTGNYDPKLLFIGFHLTKYDTDIMSVIFNLKEDYSLFSEKINEFSMKNPDIELVFIG